MKLSPSDFPLPLNPQLLQTDAPPVLAMQAMGRSWKHPERPLINLGQGLPDVLPPKEALNALVQRLEDPALHRYGPDQGLMELREALADDYERRLGIRPDPEQEILITAGANHAFILTILALIPQGQGLLLPSPIYFNHQMALQMLGRQSQEWPMCIREERFELDLERLEEYWKPDTAGVVCINPNNPTGTIHDELQIQTLLKTCIQHQAPLIYDEVYHGMVFGKTPLPHPWLMEGGREHCVLLGSFTKRFGMTGWRVGYLLAPPQLIQQALKAQDCSVICASVPGQVLAAECLRYFADHSASYAQQLGQRVRCLEGIIRRRPEFQWREPQGALFTLIPCAHPSWDLARRLASEAGLLVLPGAAFGREGEKHLRISFGFTDEPTLEEVERRFESFFEAMPIG